MCCLTVVVLFIATISSTRKTTSWNHLCTSARNVPKHPHVLSLLIADNSFCILFFQHNPSHEALWENRVWLPLLLNSAFIDSGLSDIGTCLFTLQHVALSRLLDNVISVEVAYNYFLSRYLKLMMDPQIPRLYFLAPAVKKRGHCIELCSEAEHSFATQPSFRLYLSH